MTNLCIVGQRATPWQYGGYGEGDAPRQVSDRARSFKDRDIINRYARNYRV